MHKIKFEYWKWHFFFFFLIFIDVPFNTFISITRKRDSLFYGLELRAIKGTYKLKRIVINCQDVCHRQTTFTRSLINDFIIQIDPKESQRVINIKKQKGIEIFRWNIWGEKNHLPWPFLRVTDSGRGSRPVPIREWSLPSTATAPSNAPVQRPSRPSPRPGPARSLRPFRPGSRAPANENVSFQRGPFFFSFFYDR